MTCYFFIFWLHCECLAITDRVSGELRLAKALFDAADQGREPGLSELHSCPQVVRATHCFKNFLRQKPVFCNPLRAGGKFRKKERSFFRSIGREKRSKMEASESEAIFDSFNLNPQLFINAALNIVDELIDSAFSHLHQEASTQLKVEGSDRAQDLTKGLDFIGNMIRSALDKRLTMWEKYCFLRVFVVPEGFSLPKDDEASDGDAMDVEAVCNSDLDAQLDSLRTKLILAEQESAKLKREIQALERQSVISNHQAASVNELMKLSEKISENDALKELQKLATELRAKSEKLQKKRPDDKQRAKLERLFSLNGDLPKIIGGNGLSNAKPEDVEEFLDMKL